MFPVPVVCGLALLLSPVFGEVEVSHYIVVNDTYLDWNSAETWCNDNYGTNLATIRDDSDATTMLDIVDILSSCFWIGLNDLTTDGVWEWTSGYQCDGDCAELSWWHANEPNGGTHENCGSVRGVWATNLVTLLNDAQCHSGWYFVCDAPPTTQSPTTQWPTTQWPTTQWPTTRSPTTQWPTTQSPTTLRPTTQSPTTQSPTTPSPTTQSPTTQSPTTQSPTTEVEESHYIVVDDIALDWDSAETYCNDNYGTNLATIRDDSDAATMLDIKDRLHSFWIGLNDLTSDGVWEWTSGYQCDGDCAELSWWNANEPNGGTSENCGHIRSWATNLVTLLNDAQCHSGWYFVCDAPVVEPVAANLTLEERVEALETMVQSLNDSLMNRVQSLENVISGFDDAIDSEYSASSSMPFGLGKMEHAIYALALVNLVVLVLLSVYCVYSTQKVKGQQYGKVAMFEEGDDGKAEVNAL